MAREEKINLLIDGNGTIKEIVHGDMSLADMQKHVGGLIEYAVCEKTEGFPVPPSAVGANRARFEGGDAVLCEVIDVIVNEEGLLRGMPPNVISTFAAYGEGLDSNRMLVGPSIIIVKQPQDMGSLTWVGFDWIMDRTIPDEMRDLAEMMLKTAKEMSGISEGGPITYARYGGDSL